MIQVEVYVSYVTVVVHDLLLTYLQKYTLTLYSLRAERLGKNNLQLHHNRMSVEMWQCWQVTVYCAGVYLMEAMILMYWRALCAASLCALLQEMPVPWHTVTGEVDSSAKHWYWPFTVSSSAKYRNKLHEVRQQAKNILIKFSFSVLHVCISTVSTACISARLGYRNDWQQLCMLRQVLQFIQILLQILEISMNKVI